MNRPGFLVWIALAFPAAAPALDFDAARHLLTRAGFSPTPEEVETLVPLSHEEAVKKLLDGTRTEPALPAPEWADESPPGREAMKEMSEEEKKALRETQRRHAQELKGWWCREMAGTESPLTERMTLFWHNHFTSSLQKVKFAPAMYRQNALLRRHACGSFRTLLREIARDPAMVVYLDSQSNRKGKPNENFARELLELFTLGEGHYTEADIQSAARAFTGWSVDHETGGFRVAQRQHDEGEKTFMGRTGDLDGDDVIDILLENPRTAVHVVEKLWREFVSETPDPAEVARLAGVFRKADYEMKPLLTALFASPAFTDPSNRGTMTKSPADLVIGTVRALRIPVADGRLMAQAMRGLGQDLFDPPNVKGWPGGTAWITSTTLLLRRQILERIVRGKEMDDGTGQKTRKKMRGMDLGLDGLTEADLAGLRRALLAIPPVNPEPEGADARERVAHWLLDPAYQLK